MTSHEMKLCEELASLHGLISATCDKLKIVPDVSKGGNKNQLEIQALRDWCFPKR